MLFTNFFGPTKSQALNFDPTAVFNFSKIFNGLDLVSGAYKIQKIISNGVCSCANIVKLVMI